MRIMTEEEITQAVRICQWASICTVTPDGKPYAIEATPFFDGEDICFMINPRGGTYRNVAENPNVLLKFTLAGRALSWWAGVSCHGQGAFDTDPEAIRRGWTLLGQVMEQDFSKYAERFCANPERSPMFRVRVESRTGRCSAAAGEILRFRASTSSAEDREEDECACAR